MSPSGASKLGCGARWVLWALGLSLWASSASAERVEYEDHASEPLLPVRLDGHGVLTWDGEFGAGARVDFRLMDDGFAYSRRDELAISVGLDVVFLSIDGSNPLDFWPTATLQWSIGVSDRFSFYPELGLAVVIERGEGFDGIFPNVGFGGRYALYRSVSVMGRLGWPMAASLGLTF